MKYFCIPVRYIGKRETREEFNISNNLQNVKACCSSLSGHQNLLKAEKSELHEGHGALAWGIHREMRWYDRSGPVNIDPVWTSNMHNSPNLSYIPNISPVAVACEQF